MTFTTTPSGLQFEDTDVGTGAEAAPGRNVTVHYTGWLYENYEQGAKFDSSRTKRSENIFVGSKYVLWPLCPKFDVELLGA